MKIEPFSFEEPSLPKTVIATSFMVEIENRFKAVHQLGGFLVWYGLAGGGKTTCAEWLSQRINARFEEENLRAFRSLHYEVTGSSGPNSGKRTLRTLYRVVSGYPLDNGLYRQTEAEDIADDVLLIIKRKRIGLIAVDEAGLLSVQALSSFALLLDKARLQNHALTVILIGMDDLPIKMDKKTRPQLHRRVNAWCHFKDYEIDDSYNLLKGFHKHFAALDRDNPADWEQVELVHDLTGGLPGLIVQFLARFDGIYRKYPGEVNATVLRAIHYQNFTDYNEILNAAQGTQVVNARRKRVAKQ